MSGLSQLGGWNSLEIVKLVVAALTPIAVALMGWWISRYLKRLEHLQWANQKAVEKRLDIYSQLAPLLNDLYCYFDFIGDWKMKDPVAALSLKRCADRLFYVNAALFSQRVREAYRDFIDLCFVPGPLEEYDATATLKTDVNIRREMFAKRGEAWRPEWDRYFESRERISSRDEIVTGYRKMMDAFVQEPGVGLKEH
jgi:hypothetical protein